MSASYRGNVTVLFGTVSRPNRGQIEGFIDSASSRDSSSDNGHYRSVVWRIGCVMPDASGNFAVRLDENSRIANIDGLKVESVAIQDHDGYPKNFVVTDDEHLGGIIRPLPVGR